MGRSQVKPSRQNKSPLLDLPVELRVKILRYVLRKDGPITSLGEVLMTKVPRSSCHEIYNANATLSAQVLRTCQQLYDEGGEILYGENTLSICYLGRRHRASGPDDLCYILDYTINLSLSRIEKPCDTLITVQEYFGGRKSEMEPYTLRRYSQLAKFKHYRLVICYIHRESILTACRVLQPLLLEKDVTLFPSNAGTSLHTHHLKCTRYLRCRRLQIEWPEGRSQDQDELARLEKVITGGTPVQDTYRIWRTLKYDVFDRLEVLYGTTFPYSKIKVDEDDQHGHLNPLESAAEEYDVSKYAEVCRRALPVLREWEAYHVQRLEQRTRRLEQRIEESTEDCLKLLAQGSMHA